jgi:hypothetical protein
MIVGVPKEIKTKKIASPLLLPASPLWSRGHKVLIEKAQVGSGLVTDALRVPSDADRFGAGGLAAGRPDHEVKSLS